MYQQLAPVDSDAPTYIKDGRRLNVCSPGQLLYSARMDSDKILCLYRWMWCQCCAPADALGRTFVDVYNNSVVAGTPNVFCCCCVAERTVVAYYDSRIFSNPTTTASCCTPFPFPCLHWFGCCGDVLAFRGATCGYADCFFGHAMVGLPFPWGCCCPANLVYGLTEGEGTIVAHIINTQVSKYRSSGGNFVPALAASEQRLPAPAPQQHAPVMAGVPMASTETPYAPPKMV